MNYNAYDVAAITNYVCYNAYYNENLAAQTIARVYLEACYHATDNDNDNNPTGPVNHII